MAGLLDNPEAMLALGAGLLGSRGSFGQALGQATPMMLQQMHLQREEARRKQETDAQTQSRALQQQLVQQQLAQAEAQQLAQRKQMEALRNAVGQSVPASGAITASGVNGPRPEALPFIGQRKPVDFEGLIAAGVPIEIVKALAEAPNYGRSKVARTVEEMTPNGPVTKQLDEFGQVVGSGFNKPVEARFVDSGGKIQAVNPFTLGGMGEFGKTMSPSERDASSRGWAGVRQAGERLELDRGASVADAGGPAQAALVKAWGKPPKDHRWKNDGSAEPIPGGPADIKAGELGARTEARKSATISAAQNVLDTISDAKTLVGWTTAGIGGMSKSLPMTEGRELAGKLETIKANLGFDRLQEMRQNSPTGGALGAVAVQELNALQSTVASLDQLQSPAALGKALEKIEGHYKRWLEVSGGKPVNQQRTVKRTGTANGRKVIEYSDGSIEYAD